MDSNTDNSERNYTPLDSPELTGASNTDEPHNNPLDDNKYTANEIIQEIVDDVDASVAIDFSHQMDHAIPESPFDPYVVESELDAFLRKIENEKTSSIDDVGRWLAKSCDGLRHIIEAMKQDASDTRFDLSAAKALIDHIEAFCMTNGLASVDETAKTKANDACNTTAKPECTQSTSPNSPSPPTPTSATTNVKQSKSTQTDVVIVKQEDSSHAPEIPRLESAGSTDLAKFLKYAAEVAWEEELASIRRPKPLFPGHYKTVNVPLRDTVPDQKPVINSLTPQTASTSGQLQKNAAEIIDIISIADTSDAEDDKAGAPCSRRVGGGSRGGRAHDEQFLQYSQRRPVYADEEMSDLPDYEDSDDNQYHNASCPYGNNHQNGRASAGVPTNRNGVNMPAPNDRGRTSMIAHDTWSRTRRTGGRERSASPSRRRGDHANGNRYREQRGYRPYTDDHPTTTQYNKLYNQKGPRYIRDKPEDAAFYGYKNTQPTGKTERSLRYQDRLHDIGEIPGPRTGLRLNLDAYIRDTEINRDATGLEHAISSIISETFYSSETLDAEQALNDWTRGSIQLYKGFPLVENIGFIAAENRATPDGDCYWRALASNLYGRASRWSIVKAEHHAYLRHVLLDKSHPRHALYMQLNTQFFETYGPAGPRNFTGATFKANLWQHLHMPHVWTPGAMQQVTADLYNLHLVTFTYDSRVNVCSEVAVRGAYNARHLFLLYINESHFQPLAVNEYLG